MIVNDNFNKNPDNIIFTIKDTKLFVAIITLSAKDNQKISIFFSKGFGRSVYWKKKKQKTKSENKNIKKKINLESNFVGFIKLFVLICSNVANDGKRYSALNY